MFKSALCFGFLIMLAGCSNWNEPQQEPRPWDGQKNNRPWYRGCDTVGGALEKQEREKPSRHGHNRDKKKH